MAFSEDDCTEVSEGTALLGSATALVERAEVQCDVGFVRRGDALVGPLSPYGHCVAPPRGVVVGAGNHAPSRGAMTFGPWRAAEGDRRAQESVRAP